MLHTIRQGSRLLGYIAIDSTVQGRSRGGLRIADGLSEEELRSAARAMTLKYGLIGLPQGGAKAGIVGNGDATEAEKRRLLHEFASAAKTLLLDRAYIPDADMSTGAADIRWMLESVGATVAPREVRENRSGDYTARSCLASAAAVLRRKGRSLEGRRVAVEGFGKVGSALARLLKRSGARVVAVSTSSGALYRADGLDVERLAQCAAEVGSRFVEDEPGTLDRAALLELDVDLLCPCARFHSIHAGNVDRIAAAAICAGANNPVSPEAEGVLLEHGVSCPPDFMTNSGGVLGGTLEFAGVPFDRINAVIEEEVGPRVSELLDRAEALGVAPRELAEADADERHARVRREAEHPGLLGRLRELGLDAYRRAWIPQRPVSWVAPRYLARLMA